MFLFFKNSHKFSTNQKQVCVEVVNEKVFTIVNVALNY